MDSPIAKVLEAKSRHVEKVDLSATVASAVGLMNEREIGSVLVFDGTRLVGIFTERDVVRAIGTEGKAAFDQPVSAFMTANVYRCREDTSVNELMEMMSSRRFRHVPVEKDGKLAGMISIGDVVKSRIREIEQEAEHIKAYIAG